ncbi:plasma membrane-associated cation-binding protein 1-like [Chenopodium quinoa]|uniref:Plasma membrane-associated cation-binding protein 1 n=1 Tax=Chenopodium quinoa TaxID=63459 RepID=A0A803N5W2_CHEQI|nr:plasma membrane-associated cation-binding protein 1-like [Chenopodium quinoa]XP_021745518.1 plasma membrane-associated cation-binding protein 1-like [Chenopodium quinoa]
MGYWKTKVLPQIKKVFGVDVAKKAAAVEACKSFDDSKEELSKEFEEKKAELQPKVLEIYEASSAEIKTLVKDPKEAGLKKHSADVQSFLEKLDKIDFPGSKVALEACSKFGPALAPGPVKFVFEKVSTFIVTEEKPREIEAPTAAVAEEVTTAKETSEAEKEIATVSEEKPSEVAATVAADAATAETAAPPKVEQPQTEEPPKKA